MKPQSPENLNTKWHTIHLIKTAINSDLILIPNPSQTSALNDSYVTGLLTNQRVTILLGYMWSLLSITPLPLHTVWWDVI